VPGVVQGSVPCSDPSDPVMIKESFSYRINPLLPKVQDNVYAELLLFVQQHLKTLTMIDNDLNIKVLPKIEDVRQFTINWLNSVSHYSKTFKNHLLICFDKIYYDNTFHLGPKKFICNTFPKAEFFEEPKRARLINSRSDYFKVAVGAFIQAIEHEIYKLHNFVKGTPINQIPSKLNNLDKYKYKIETDYSSFESCFSPQYTACVEQQLFKHFLVNNPEVMKIIDLCYNDGGRPRVNILKGTNYSASVIGSRMSGEMWTSLANGFSNYINLKFLLKDYPSGNVDFYVEGDDGIIGIETKYLTNQMFTNLGFKIKMVYGEDLSHTRFCGNLFVPGLNQLVINPEQITRFFFTCSQKFINMKLIGAKKLLLSKAMNLYSTGQFTPIIAVLAYQVIKILKSYKTISYLLPYWEIAKQRIKVDFDHLNYPQIHPLNRQLYAEQYGISISGQLRLENFISKWTTYEDICLPVSMSQWDDPTHIY